MAIDDNKVYGLTGAQLKELPGKIEAAKGGFKELTTADYDYPDANPDGVALWRLPDGIYYPASGVKIYSDTGSASGERRSFLNTAHLVIKRDDKQLILGGMLYNTRDRRFLQVTNAASGATSGTPAFFLPDTEVVDNLTTTVNKPLSANQGKVLKGLIDALDTNLQSQIDAIVTGSDVKDIVGTKADLNNYDTSTLGDNDIIKVLSDESESDTTTYYRWDTDTSAFTLIGSEGPYYTKSQTDTALATKADASTVYTKSEVDTALSGKVDNATLNNYATTSAMNTALATKANSADVYTKTQVDTQVASLEDAIDAKADAPAAGTTYVTDTAMTTALATKADASTTYTKTQVDTALANKVDTATLADYVEADDLATVATSGSYNDLTNKPTIPTVNDATLTIQKNGTTVDTFTANSSTNKTVNIETPVITMTTTDPGEGSTLAANNFIAVYEA